MKSVGVVWPVVIGVAVCLQVLVVRVVVSAHDNAIVAALGSAIFQQQVFLAIAVIVILGDQRTVGIARLKLIVRQPASASLLDGKGDGLSGLQRDAEEMKVAALVGQTRNSHADRKVRGCTDRVANGVAKKKWSIKPPGRGKGDTTLSAARNRKHERSESRQAVDAERLAIRRGQRPNRRLAAHDGLHWLPAPCIRTVASVILRKWRRDITIGRPPWRAMGHSERSGIPRVSGSTAHGDTLISL